MPTEEWYRFRRALRQERARRETRSLLRSLRRQTRIALSEARAQRRQAWPEDERNLAAHARSRVLIKRMTRAERSLWSVLKKIPDGVGRFVRQQPLCGGRFIVDFYCPAYLLAVEVDGSCHFTEARRACDRMRDAVLSRAGYTLIRFPNEVVEADPTAVVRAIRKKIVALKYR